MTKTSLVFHFICPTYVVDESSAGEVSRVATIDYILNATKCTMNCGTPARISSYRVNIERQLTQCI